ncbi:MAG: SAM-dependent methyltransferase [Gemmatimonadetes bacterium]|nr:SAM-dependent methyltransferase [Gemmatimonadota bacterium]MYG85479.1 SAM-dependent methyltransferase [Gemmatimonadota bacterium]MYJ88220.1 SAM-dependent methyltransferase [Gemmatimonadota bacterium]
MPTPINKEQVRERLEDFDLQPLFIEDLGWDHGGENLEVTVGDRAYRLDAIAHKRGMVAYQQVAQSDGDFPDYPTRQKIEKSVTKAVREHIIVYTPHDRSSQHWQWVKREPGRPDRPRSHFYSQEQSGEALIQKLERLVVSIEEEEDLSIVDVSGRVRAAFDVERVTKRFYDRFKTEHQAFLGFIEGILEMADREWYASIMLNRMMFIYFIQKRGFLDSDIDYLRNKLNAVQEAEGEGKFHGFYRLFLMRLFHEGLGRPEADRSAELTALIGNVPYLNGGLFDVHDLERDNPQIEIPDEAFECIFDFFDAYQWHLDDRILRNDNEINPDVLGYIFEKYINQKQMGAYYTKEDITGYISRNTILPYLFDEAKKHCPIAFTSGGGVWRLLQDDPDKYFYDSVRHGITYDVHDGKPLVEKRSLPPDIAAGLQDVTKRDNWNEAAPAEYALLTETWREHVARRERYEEIYAKLASGEVTAINDLITYNLNIEQFAQDVISKSEGPELVRAFWKAVTSISVLDPTCGSGAFLFAALNILEPVYSACLDAMQQFLEDQYVSKRKHHPESLKDFRNVRDEVASHDNEIYFILKSIIINNLYGVDIMEEAVEICKLRLFLKLVAQLESYDQIEPLPDIDFNVRGGNTLVGFASLAEVERALGGDLFKLSELPKIEARAGNADQAFRQFKSMQTQHEIDAGGVANAKAVLRGCLDELRVELDSYLAGEYGIKTDDSLAYEQWRESHQPFHWFVEFFGIMQSGGFDVIVGNPPYVEYSNVKADYTVIGYSTESCGNLYSYVLERSYATLPSGGRMGMIVQLSVSCTQRMIPVQTKLHDDSVGLWFSHFDDRPAKLFDGLQHIRVTIILSHKEKTNNKRTYSTSYSRWRSIARVQLFHSLALTSIGEYLSIVEGSIPKIGQVLGSKIIHRISDHEKLGNRLLQHGSGLVYFHNAPQYWIRAMDYAPYFWNERDGEQISTQVKKLVLDKKPDAAATVAALNSSLFYWWFLILSDCRHLNLREIEYFPLGLDRMTVDMKARLANLTDRLMANFNKHKTRKETLYQTTGKVIYDEFNQKPSKPIVDEIDRVLAEHYGFTDEELDFIVNYDIKYRMGR